MNRLAFWKRCLLILAVYALLAGFTFHIIRDDWRVQAAETGYVTRSAMLYGDESEMRVEQTLRCSMDTLEEIRLDADVRDPETAGIHLRIFQGDSVLSEADVDGTSMAASGFVTFSLTPAVEQCRGQEICLEFLTRGGVVLWSGDSISAGRFQLPAPTDGKLWVNGEERGGTLVYALSGQNLSGAYRIYWPVMGGIGALGLILALLLHGWMRNGHENMLTTVVRMIRKYRFLLKTLVRRDFKIKYKGSVLGVIWSFLNPLIMMLVYFFVFSTIFRSNTPNFAVYLMSGVVLYNYCSDATTLGMQAIVGNAGLITKVYLPKYIYPLSKTISSSINLVISTAALFVVMAFTGAPIGACLLRLPVLLALLCLLIVFCSGLGMLLSCCLVFFRDIQFLWSVFLTIWNFMTPIFYTESIIPAKFLGIYHLNPLYQFVTAVRTITLEGRAPLPANILWCILASAASFLLGAWVFHRYQDRFVLYL